MRRVRSELPGKGLLALNPGERHLVQSLALPLLAATVIALLLAVPAAHALSSDPGQDLRHEWPR